VGYSITPTSSPPRRHAYLGKIFPINRLALEDIIQFEIKSGKRKQVTMPNVPFSSRRYNRRRTYYPRRSSAYAYRSRTARAAAFNLRRAEARSLNTAVRGLALQQGEFKSVDVQATLAVDTNFNVQLLNGIARGDEIFERTGREVLMKSISVRGSAYVTSGTGIDQIFRFLVVYDRQTNATAITAGLVIDPVNSCGSRDLENRHRFKILMDRTFTMNASAEPGSRAFFQFYRRLAHPITFNSGDAGTVADITTGSIYLIAIGNVAPGATAGSILVGSRIRYLDK